MVTTVVVPNPSGHIVGLLAIQKGVVQLVTVDPAGITQPAICNRNEQTMSATVPKKVTCIGVLKLEDMLDNSIKSKPQFIAQGGWAYMWNPTLAELNGLGDMNLRENDQWVFKVESSSALNGRFSLICSRMVDITRGWSVQINTADPLGSAGSHRAEY